MEMTIGDSGSVYVFTRSLMGRLRNSLKSTRRVMRQFLINSVDRFFINLIGAR